MPCSWFLIHNYILDFLKIARGVRKDENDPKSEGYSNFIEEYFIPRHSKNENGLILSKTGLYHLESV